MKKQKTKMIHFLVKFNITKSIALSYISILCLWSVCFYQWCKCKKSETMWPICKCGLNVPLKSTKMYAKYKCKSPKTQEMNKLFVLPLSYCFFYLIAKIITKFTHSHILEIYNQVFSKNVLIWYWFYSFHFEKNWLKITYQQKKRW